MAAEGGADKTSRQFRDVYRKVSRRMWTDGKFMDLSAPPPSAQFLWVHLLTGPHTGQIPGLSVAGQAQLAEQLGWDLGPEGLPEGLPEGFRQAFAELSAKELAVADWKARLVWLPKAIYHNEPESPNVVRSWRLPWIEAPECDLKRLVWQQLRAFLEAKGKAFLEAFDEVIPEPLGESRARTGTGVRAGTRTTNTLFEGVAPSPSAPVAPPPPKASRLRSEPLPEIPAALDTPEFREAWGERMKERAQKGSRGKVTSSQVSAQFRKLAKVAAAHGIAVAVRCVEEATEGGWQAVVFEDRLPGANGNGKSGHKLGAFGVTSGVMLAERRDLGRSPELDAEIEEDRKRLKAIRERADAARREEDGALH